MYKDSKTTIGDIFPNLKAEYVSKAEAMQATKIRRWTDREHQVLVQAVGQNRTPEEIAKMINRTPKAISVRITNMGIKRQMYGQPLRKMKRYKRRVTYNTMKARILGFVQENQPVSMTQVIEGVTGNANRIRDVVHRLVSKGELKSIYLPKSKAQRQGLTKIVLPNFVHDASATAVQPKQARPMQIVEPVQPVKAMPEVVDDVPQIAGRSMFERNLGNLILFAGIGAAGVWLVMILLAISLIESMGG